MSHRSKQDLTPRPCKTCGITGYAQRGERYSCPYKALHALLSASLAGQSA